MFLTIAGAAALLAAAEPKADPAPKNPPTEQPAKGESAKDKAEAFDIEQMMGVFDKLFPAQPDPAPDRLALARVTANGLFPDGTYARIIDTALSGMVDRFFSLSVADFVKDTDSETEKTTTWREEAIRNDPHFEERMRIMERVITDEVGKIAGLLEPKLRDGLARSMARRFEARQLADINAFLATDSGRAFGTQSMAMWVDSDVMRAMVRSLPEMITAMPAAMKRLEEETAHLPKPPKKEEEKAKEADEEATESEE